MNLVTVLLMGGEKYVNTRNIKSVCTDHTDFNKSVKIITETISRQAIYMLGTGCVGNISILKNDAK